MLKKDRDAGKLAGFGRPPHEPTEQTIKQVEFMASRGCSQYEIATVIGIDENTLSKHYRHELDAGPAKGKASLRQQQFKLAMDGNVTMAIWLGKTWLGQKETVVTERKFGDLSDDELNAAVSQYLASPTES